jgi:hypothetical protein
MKLLFVILSLLGSSWAYAHGFSSGTHQSYRVQEGAKTIYISSMIANYRKDIDTFYVVVKEDDETIPFASNQRTYTQVYGSQPREIAVYVKNDKPLPRTLQVCSYSYGKNIDVITKKPANVQVRSGVCNIVKLRAY